MSKFIPFTDEELYQAHHKDIKEYLESIGEKVLHSGTEYMWETHDRRKNTRSYLVQTFYR